MTLAQVSPKKHAGKIHRMRVPELVERNWQEPALGPSTVSLGICSTCNHAETCSFRRDTPRPVLECDEFDDHVDLPRRDLLRGDLELKSSAVSSESGSEQYTGLCVNCEVRTTCTLRTIGQSIWHCEEYL